MSVHVPPMIGTTVSHNPGILVSEDNSALGAQTNGSRNMSSAN